MGQYTNKGLYNKYDKNNKERDALDYYATPPNEVYNILDTLGIDFSGKTILEPCIGGGHMVEAIKDYIIDNNQINVKIIGTDIKDRGYGNGNALEFFGKENYNIGVVEYDYGLDYMADDYPFDIADWVIMNPPYSIIEPFVIRSLEIAHRGVIMLARLQFLEGEKRFNSILKDNPPTDVYVYIDRIACHKDGDFSIKPSSAQAYAWFVWDKAAVRGKEDRTRLHFLRRWDKR